MYRLYRTIRESTHVRACAHARIWVPPVSGGTYGTFCCFPWSATDLLETRAVHSPVHVLARAERNVPFIRRLVFTPMYRGCLSIGGTSFSASRFSRTRVELTAAVTSPPVPLLTQQTPPLPPVGATSAATCVALGAAPLEPTLLPTRALASSVLVAVLASAVSRVMAAPLHARRSRSGA